jgi:hypothetical protein
MINKMALVIVLVGTVLVVFATPYVMGALDPIPNVSETVSTDATDEVATVTTAPDIFDRMGERWEYGLGEGWETSPVFLVVTQDTDKAAAALRAASPRLMRVNERGQEVDLEASPDEYTPGYVSEVDVTNEGLEIYVDTDGELPKAMADAMLRIVVEELVAANVTAHVTAASSASDTDVETYEPPVRSA